jgi:hypothetical protein
MIAERDVRERPILFSAPMVLAILDGRKTQTRRVVKPQHRACRCGYTRTGWAIETEDGTCTCKPIKGPTGDVGDRLWVRETWAPYPNMNGGVWFKAGVPVYCAGRRTGEWDTHDRLMGLPVPADVRWRPSIFMPRWASRITLEVTKVRVERVGDISHADIAAEGILEHWDPEFSQTPYNYGRDKERFARLWDEINGAKDGCRWEDNPICWVRTFRRIKP